MLQINDRIEIPKAELQFSFAKSPGPGGQNVNKLNTKAILRWRIRESQAISAAQKARFYQRFGGRVTQDGEVLIVSHEARTQAGNQAACLDRLKAMLLQILTPPKPRKATRPTAGSRRRRLDNKRKTSDKKRSRTRPDSFG